MACERWGSATARVRARRGSATRHAWEALASAARCEHTTDGRSKVLCCLLLPASASESCPCTAILERGGAFGACVFSFKKALPHLENKLRTLILCIS